jgi:hypothetical protein
VGGELKLAVALGGDLSLIDHGSGALIISAAYSSVWENNDQDSPVENHIAREHAMIDFHLGLQFRITC